MPPDDIADAMRDLRIAGLEDRMRSLESNIVWLAMSINDLSRALVLVAEAANISSDPSPEHPGVKAFIH